MSGHSDDDLLALVKGIARPTPSAGETARLARTLDDAIAHEQEARHRRISPAWAVVAVVAAASASAGAALLWQGPPEASPAQLGTVMATTTTTTPRPAPALEPEHEPDPPAREEPAVERAAVDDVVTPPKKKKAPHAPKSWQARADELVKRDQLVAAARIYAGAVVDSDDPRGAALSLRGLAGRDPAVIDALDPLVAKIDDDEVLARVLRLSCELRLRHRRDADAVDACRVFGQRFPAHPAARALAFGAGGLAEELGDLRNAVEEYSRSIVLAPLLGASSNDALLGRARVRTRLGELDEARADLRVYLQQEHRPADTHDDEVQGLARALHVDLP
ncbi:MAG: hypothetical protein Q8O67_16465 [Deltaproteobacteria bacterium]|nr:hypothetical protein [Deltaproteobacteria bacterium]